MLWGVLAAAAALLILLCLTRVGIWAAFDGTFRLALRVGFLRIQVLPARKKPAGKPEEKPPPKTKQEPPEGEKRKKKPFPFTAEDIRDALGALLPALGRALRRMGRGIQVRPLRISLTLGGQEDPAGTAQLYGQLQAVLWGGMPLAEKLVDIRDPSIHTGVDFEASAPVIEGEAGVAIRIGTLIAVGVSLAVPALKWLLRVRKRARSRPPKPEESAAQGPVS